MEYRAIPSPPAVATLALLHLGRLLDREDYFNKARETLKANHIYMERVPQGYLSLLLCVDFLIHPPKGIAIIGKIDSEDTHTLLRTVHGQFVPNRILAFIDSDQADAQKIADKIPLLADKSLIDNKATAYVCENYACKLPATTPETLLKQLGVK